MGKANTNMVDSGICMKVSRFVVWHCAAPMGCNSQRFEKAANLTEICHGRTLAISLAHWGSFTLRLSASASGCIGVRPPAADLGHA